MWMLLLGIAVVGGVVWFLVSKRARELRQKGWANRLTSWFCYDVLLALIPLAASLFVRHVIVGSFGGVPEATKGTPEIVFLAVMLYASSLRGVNDLREAFPKDVLFRLLGFALIFGLLAAAIVYGVLIYNQLDERPQAKEALTRLFWYALPLALGAVAVCGIIQFLIGRLEDSAQQNEDASREAKK